MKGWYSMSMHPSVVAGQLTPQEAPAGQTPEQKAFDWSAVSKESPKLPAAARIRSQVSRQDQVVEGRGLKKAVRTACKRVVALDLASTD